MKPSPYVELIVDARNPRRTEIVKNTSQPKWNETFTVLVTPHSILQFSVLDHNNFRKDTTIGEKKLDLHQLLTCYSGRCENLELTLDLMSESKQGDTPVKTGELISVLHSLNVDLSSNNRVGNAAIPQTSSSNSLSHRNVLNGIRATVRVQNEAVVAHNSRSVIERSVPNSQSSNNVPNGKF